MRVSTFNIAATSARVSAAASDFRACAIVVARSLVGGALVAMERPPVGACSNRTLLQYTPSIALCPDAPRWFTGSMVNHEAKLLPYDRTTPMKMGAVVGETLRALREEEGQTQQDVANMLARWGLAWTRAQVASIEAGRRESLGLDELIILSNAFDLRLRDWFPGYGTVRLGPGVYLARDKLRMIFSLNAVPELRADVERSPKSEAEQNAARALGVTIKEVKAAALELWGVPFTDERELRLRRMNDRLTGAPKHISGKRSAISRGLKDELREHLALRSGQDDQP